MSVFKCRVWSNSELRKFANKYTGNVLHVSAWKDEDKQGEFYKDYFFNASSYKTTNHKGDRGVQGDEIELDLLNVPQEMMGKCDVVFNHTTLEHIFDTRLAFKGLCDLSKDVVIVVVPKSQETHFTESYGDYWRFTELTLAELFKENGFEVEYISEGGGMDGIYLFCIGKRK